MALAAIAATRVGGHTREEPVAQVANATDHLGGLAEAARAHFRELLRELQALPDLTDEELEERLRDRMNDLRGEPPPRCRPAHVAGDTPWGAT